MLNVCAICQVCLFSSSEVWLSNFSFSPDFTGGGFPSARGWVYISLPWFSKTVAHLPARLFKINNSATPYQQSRCFFPATIQINSSPPIFIFCLSVSGHHCFQSVLFLRSQTLSDQMPSSNLKLRTPTPLILHFIKVSPQARAGEDETDNVLKKHRPMTKEITRNICPILCKYL